MNISSEVIEAIQELTAYSILDEWNNYEEEYGIELAETILAEDLEDQDHILYHILILKEFLK